MAEKEERISIIKWNTKDSICPAPTELQCGGAKSCEECKVGISCQEAIKRIAKAIEYNLNGSSFNSLAEAVLNALLETDK